MTTDPTELAEFVVTVEYHALARPETTTVIARDLDDAKEIVRRLFVQSHTDACAIDKITGGRKP